MLELPESYEAVICFVEELRNGSVWTSEENTPEIVVSIPLACLGIDFRNEEKVLDYKELMEAIKEQEQSLILPGFKYEDAWCLGQSLYTKAIERHLPLFMEVFVNGGVRFAAASPKAHNNLADWVRRKRNLTLRMGQSSYLTDVMFKEHGISLEAFGMDLVNFGLGGGSIPIAVSDIGIIGAVTVSGLPNIDDHNLAVECIAELLGQDFNDLKLSQ
ncbi:hypothetical protein RHSP_41497 (plasmid) [Rhizobium freirei PRF 81]|uniref:Uncharacterized protein n=1 Tax=Rhizobium freirei PRF 81 TaxID=363754 RepID=N6TTN1_9HYPH|nr:heme-binding protein [Rhizobium freirei]ENN83849.1 hypothetical protein RHSP_41497 [Rhizobium freirei PRF 81]